MAAAEYFPRLLIACWISLVLSGCLKQNRYDYNRIRADYLPLTCPSEAKNKKMAPLGACKAGETLTIEDAIRIAWANNPNLLMAQARVEQSAAMIRKADAAFYPALGFYTEYNQGDAPSAFLFKTIDQRKLPPNTDFNNPGWFENYETGLNARLNLFNGGRDLINRRIADTDRIILQRDGDAVKNALTGTVIRAYYNSLAARDFIAIAEESVSTVESQLRIMRVRCEAGDALKSDILSLEVRRAQVREEVARSQNNFDNAQTALAALLGISPDIELAIADAKAPAIQAPATVSEGITSALLNRPEIQKAREQVIRSRMAMDRDRSGYLPRVDLVGKYYVDDPDMAYNTDRDNWTAGVIFNWDLFTGFSTAADIDGSEAFLRQMLAADRKTVIEVKSDVKTAYRNLDEARTRFNVAEASVGAAEETLKLVQRQYEGGSATITRYLEAEFSRNRAKFRRTAAFYDREKAQADVGRAIGYWFQPPDQNTNL